jgi:hypothetical protein
VKVSTNPYIDEGVRVYLSDTRILRTYVFLVGVLFLVLLLWWPRDTIASALRGASPPDTFIAVAVGFLLCLVILGMRYGSESFSPERLSLLREYAALAPVRPLSIVAGKALFGLLHTGFMLVLGAPFLVASFAVSGVDGVRALQALLVIGTTALAVRMCGLLFLTLTDGHSLLRDSLLLFGALFYLTITGVFASAASPIAALASLASQEMPPGAASSAFRPSMASADLAIHGYGMPPGAAAAGGSFPQAEVLFGSVPFFLVSVTIGVAAALLFAGGALASLGVVKRRAKKKRNVLE